MNRIPAVGGRFYPVDPKSLREDVRRHIDVDADKAPAVGIVSPHAGFMYSGDVAGAVYSRVEIPETVILIGPNHTGDGPRASVMIEGAWSMPMGEVRIDDELARAICDASPMLKEDAQAHRHEHSLETQVPFLQYFSKDFRIVPICLKRLNLKECDEISRAVSDAVAEVGREVLIVASSDMTHYESHESASRKDRKAIEKILNSDPEGLFNTVADNGITMCGVHPATVMLLCAGRMGAKHTELVKYMTSGEVSGDMKQVVGYAGIIVR